MADFIFSMLCVFLFIGTMYFLFRITKTDDKVIKEEPKEKPKEKLTPYYNPISKKQWKENKKFTCELGDGSKRDGVAIWNKEGKCFLLFNRISGWGYRNKEFLPQEGIAYFLGYECHWQYPSNYVKDVIFTDIPIS